MSHVKKQRLPAVVLDQWLLKMPRAHGLDQLILQAGLTWTVSRLLLSSAVLACCSFFLLDVMLRQPWVFSVLAAAGAAASPFLYVIYRKSRRLRKLESQLPDALDLVVRALRSGHSFASALQMIGDEMAQPIADEFRAVHDEVSFGVSLQQALTNLSARVPLNDLRYFVVSVMIQRDSGGNLTEVLTNLSRLIRERLKLAAVGGHAVDQLNVFNDGKGLRHDVAEKERVRPARMLLMCDHKDAPLRAPQRQRSADEGFTFKQVRQRLA